MTVQIAGRARARLRRSRFAGCVHYAVLLLGLACWQNTWAAELGEASSATAPSAAQKETARAWLREGDQFFERKDYARALERYAAAYRLVRVPTVGVQVARVQAARGEWVEANATAMEVVNLPREPAEPEVFAQARARANQLQQTLVARIPSVSVVIAPSQANARIQIDGADMPSDVPEMSFRLNPGVHRLRVRAAGYRAHEGSFQLEEGQQQTLSVVLLTDADLASTGASSVADTPGANAAATDTGSGARTRSYVGLGVASVSALVGGVTGVLALSSKPDCAGNKCTPDQADEIARSKRYGNIATVSFGVSVLAGAYAAWEYWANASARTDTSAHRELNQTEFVLVPSAEGATFQVSGSF